MNALSRVTFFGGLLLLAMLLLVGAAVQRSDQSTGIGVAREQPVPFSHKHHVRGLGIDCRYCHVSVEVSSTAGMPSTDTCMTCHSQIWTQAAELAPVRESMASNRPIAWNRVYRVPDFVRFNHSIHVAKGIGCVSCHGRVDSMPLVFKTATLFMGWCLDCHREPERFIRPREHVFNLAWTRPDDPTFGERLVKAYGIKRRVTCSTCHY